jgi:hypothetical protein
VNELIRQKRLLPRLGNGRWLSSPGYSVCEQFKQFLKFRNQESLICEAYFLEPVANALVLISVTLGKPNLSKRIKPYKDMVPGCT